MFAMLLYVLVLGGLIVLAGGAFGAFRDGIKRKARWRGLLLAGAVVLLSLFLIVTVLI